MNFTIFATSSLKEINVEYNSLEEAFNALRDGKHNDLIYKKYSTLVDNDTKEIKNPKSFVVTFMKNDIIIEIYDDYRE